MLSDADPRFALKTMPDLPGCLFTPAMDIVDASVDDALARMFLLIPQANGRDLNDIAVVAQGGKEWLRQGSTLYRPLAGIPSVALGTSTVTIGSEGFNEWRSVARYRLDIHLRRRRMAVVRCRFQTDRLRRG